MLEDEAFEAIVAMYNKKMKAKKDMMKKEEEVKAEVDASDAVENSKADEEVSEELFDGVKSTEATLIDASEDDDELQVTRASVAEWLENNVLRK